MMSKERPILFSAPMVQTILEGRKTQTRRIAPITDLSITQHEEGMISWAVHFSKPLFGSLGSYSGGRFSEKEARRIIGGLFCPYGLPRDTLWVRENFSGPNYQSKSRPRDWLDCDPIWYWADGSPESGDWTKPKPSIFMPRWASRITLEIVSVRVERLQDISHDDAMAEGMAWDDAVYDYSQLWNAINGADSWAANPWVWAIEFKRIGA